MIHETTHFKKVLTEQLHTVEEELKNLGWKNDAGEWDAAVKDIDQSATEADEVADRIEEFEENQTEIAEIQVHWHDIKRALAKIEEGTYGLCEICGEAIEEDRLEANPSARTCKTHIDEEKNLS
ncbi:MAG: TraR/DksA C4-type zinc finger protein [Candidatus Adlerbacteria bacterium]|nr:TraR/DksA C4-type zinc finger protein [Candidatus Adlerbacteria bacterium]